MLRRLEDPQKLATTLNNLGVLHDRRGEDDEARHAWHEAMSLAENHGYASTLASAHNNLGIFLERRGDPRAAIEHYSDALAIQAVLGEISEMVIFLGNLAHAHGALDQHVDATRALERKLALHEQVEDQRGAATTLHELATAAGSMTPEAEAYYARAIEAFAALGEPMEVALVEMDRARAWSLAGDHAKALAFGEHARGLRVQLGNESHLAAALDNLAQLYCDAGDHAKSIALTEQALALTEKLGERDATLIVLCNLADEYAASDLDAKAIECYERALRLAEDIGDRETSAMVGERLAELGPKLSDSRSRRQTREP